MSVSLNAFIGQRHSVAYRLHNMEFVVRMTALQKVKYKVLCRTFAVAIWKRDTWHSRSKAAIAGLVLAFY